MLAPAVISRGGIHSFTVIPAVLGGYPSEEKAAWIYVFALARRSATAGKRKQKFRGNKIIAKHIHILCTSIYELVNNLLPG
jgi:hypothetical protein